MTRQILAAELVFDGQRLRSDMAVVVESDRIIDLIDPPRGMVPLPGIISPGFIDLQVNGGGGLMVGADTTLDSLRTICSAHLGRGCAGVLPTLITDTPQATAQVLSAGIEATAEGLPGFLGLHLEGPHLDARRAGAHDPRLIRPMTDRDLRQLVDAAPQLPALMVTLAPEAATVAQIGELSRAGIVVSLGHSDCRLAEAQACFDAGARAATHLFNAMSPMNHREPGLVGAALSGDASAGVIADGFHADPAALTVALRARPDGLFLVSDCMAVAGTDLDQFTLQGRRILRRNGRLTLADGTLAGADLRLDRAMQVAVAAGATPERALQMATSIPAGVIASDMGQLRVGQPARLVHLRTDLSLRAVMGPQGWVPAPAAPTMH